jgi:transposase
MAAYSIDLRQKILRAWERHLGSQGTTGNIAPKPHAGGQRPRLGMAAQAVVQRLMGANPDATLEELCTRVAAETGVRVSVPTMCRVLQRLDLPRKKSRSTPASVIRRASGKRARTTARRSRRSTSGA